MTKYDFYADCGGRWLETFDTVYPTQYASELAAFHGIDPDEITWESAEGAVDNFDKFFPSEITPSERAKIEQIEALHAEIRQCIISLDAAGIAPGKLHERVASACQLLTEYKWQMENYKALYRARLEMLAELEAKLNDE